MSRLDLALFAALVLSALFLVQVSYESRRLFAELDREQTRAVQLEGERERLQLEARAQSTPLRVERVARDRLGMRPATAAVTEYMAMPEPAGPASAAAGAAR
ncbi:MAG TPA: cell division protein FtsL [Methylibium sp.]|uniref:cell division protein FtsL n=1 Tax=Methylibium sp. TaxID=2067992 RepID=UPI002DBD912B|nr:cell division protein FtsL [Methylibium sp.]HEU4460585.1 cell division protein FtsL [Methylibium sp.]